MFGVHSKGPDDHLLGAVARDGAGGDLRGGEGLEVIWPQQAGTGLGVEAADDDVCRILRASVLDLHVGVVGLSERRLLVRRHAVSTPPVPDRRRVPVDRLVLVLAGAAIVDVDVLLGWLAGRHDRPGARAASRDQGILELALLLE